MSESPSIRQRSVAGGPDSPNLNSHPVLNRVLAARGITHPDQLELSLGRLLRPDTLTDIDSAAAMLAEAVCENRSILVVGDFDADGATGTAVAVRCLQAFGARRVSFRVPNRFEFGYGLTVGLVETLVDSPPDLLITVDSGISCNAGVQRARELGCTVVITDHHLPGEQLPAANAIVNPNVGGDTFDSKALAGVGVVFYLMSVVRQKLRAADWFNSYRTEPGMASFLDLVALGTVADLVPLDANNRILVRQGIERIRRGLAHAGVMALLRLGKRDYRFANASDLGFAVGPRLNAAGRLEDMSTGIRCLLSDDPAEAGQLAQQLHDLNQDRKNLQEQMQVEAMDQVNELIASLRGQPLPSALCLFDPGWHQGIVGLVASRIKDAVHRPVIAFAPESDGQTALKGSARSVKGLHIRDVLAYVDSQQPGLMRAFGGHAMAAGLTIEKEDLDLFEKALSHAIDVILNGEQLTAETLTDGAVPGPELNLELAVALENLGPWGQRFPEPVFDGVFNVIDSRVVGGSHLKMIVISADGGQELDAIAFNRLPEDLPGSGAVRMLFRLGINRWRGQESCQLMIERIVVDEDVRIRR